MDLKKAGQYMLAWDGENGQLIKCDEFGNLIAQTVNSGVVYSAASSTLEETEISDDIPVGQYTQLSLDVTVTGGTGVDPLYSVAIDRKGANGIYYQVATTTDITEGSGARSLSIGVGLPVNVAFGDMIRIREVVSGTGDPTITRSISIIGK